MDASQSQSNPSGRAEPPARSFDLYAQITQQIVEMLQKGVVPWRSNILGAGSAGLPRNLSSGKTYRGVNLFLLAFVAYARGYESSYWLSYRQAQERGGNVKSGEKSTLVVFWKPLESRDPKTGEKKTAFVLRYYRVFNARQCEKVDVPDAPVFTPSEVQRVEAADALVKGYADGPAITHGGVQASYRPKADVVQIPEPSRFATTSDYYATLLHELSHSSGHSSRLNRQIDTDPKPFGSPDYGKEELIAEMSASFLCGHTGIAPATIENQAAYISGWLGTLKADKRLVITAAGAAARSADWIRGIRPGSQGAEPEPASDTTLPEIDALGKEIG